MTAQPVRFDESSRSSHSNQPPGPGGVTAALKKAAESVGLDAPSELYNEALSLAAQGEHEAALERLRMLLCLDPHDGDGHLLAAKVHVARQEWTKALVSLDAARSAGATVPMTLRGAVEEHLRAGADTDSTENDRASHGEAQALRQEARRLRSENARLTGRVHDLTQEVRGWAWFTTGVSAVCGIFILANLAVSAVGAFTASETTPPAPVTEAPTTQALPAEAPLVTTEPTSTAAATETQPTAEPLQNAATLAATEAATALAEAPTLDGTSLQVSVSKGKATLSGVVDIHLQRKKAEELVGAVGGIGTVDVSRVKVLARTKGTSHTVSSGDSLSSIAYRYYGDAGLANAVLKGNASTLKGRADLQIGMKLKIPAVE